MIERVRVGVVAAAIAAAVLMMPAVALAAAPANDDFDEREVLSGLPIEETRSNVGATKEDGENLAPFSSGHSVWFEWTAADSGWVTIGGCSEDFTAVLGVYQGDSVGSLTPITSGNASEGPHFCDYASGGVQSFWAESGETYVIAEDSDGMYFPDSPPPITEGEFTLRIEATPLPPNDAFSAATVLSGKVHEEPDGNRFYFAAARGYTWGASKEDEEPDHGGDSGGASVWYSWAPPESGTALISACCFFQLVSVYRGGSLAELEPAESGGWPSHSYSVVGGETYRIAVDGPYDDAEGAARMGSFNLMVSMNLPPKPLRDFGSGGSTQPPQPMADPPPRTRLGKRKISPDRGTATFRFSANEAGSRFRCRLDKRAWRNCKSPVKFSNLALGRHVFKVLAVDPGGNADPTPAVARFRLSD